MPGAQSSSCSPRELQGPGVVFCPNPKMPLWSNHPRVFIDVATAGVGKCPYCGTEYRLKAGEKVHSRIERTSARDAAAIVTALARRRAAVDRRRGDGRAAARRARRARRAAHGRGAALGRAGVSGDARGRRDRRAAVRARPARLVGAPSRRARPARPLRRRLRAAELDQVGAGAVAGAHPARASAIAARAGRCCSTARCRIRAGDRRWSAFYGALAGPSFDATRRPRLQLDDGVVDAAARPPPACTRGALLGLRAGRRVRPGQALAGAALRRARALAARRRRRARSRCSARPASARSATRSPPLAPGACASSPAGPRCSTRSR